MRSVVSLVCLFAGIADAQELTQIQTLRDGTDGLQGAWSVGA